VKKIINNKIWLNIFTSVFRSKFKKKINNYGQRLFFILSPY